ncbi:Predicted arabinose efflux permease, MFS family [Saccharopolyspora kobensis]|uniref:Predicted arabinose efflux permease, MFS family n=1 Tax=Saccharopolyspora kobensis TaxID=146035 RepID=A0A1H6ATC1_9PSEU|nr:MFS transporter [Saccharopolyspora kobensis]SEG51297.1 Predicted arabinose efflux permease, MFS family [Saccharopolyspora kobensis]SFE77473.1 Predicted arabinose efflux permease, MFS family [Saccharopolyspora kobensis]
MTLANSPAPVPLVDRARELRTGLFVLVVLTAGAYLPSPLYPAYQDAFAVSDLAMTLIYATFALVSAPALLLFGSASDVMGPRSVLRISIALAAIGSACFAFASGLEWLLVARAAQGLALGAVTGAASSLISERTSGRVSGAVLASTAFVAGTAAGPIAGGALAEYAPAPHVLPFLLHLVLLGIGWRRVAKLTGSAPQTGRWTPTRPQIPPGTRVVFASAAATGFLAWTVAGLFLAVIPALLDRSAQGDQAVIGAILGAVLICSVLTQPLVPRLGARNAQLTGLGALLASLVLLAGGAGGSVPITLLAAVVAGAGHGLAYGGAAAAVDAVAPAGERGAITGALHLAFYLGAGLPAIAVGLVALGHPLATATSWVTAFAAALVPLAGAAVVLAGPGGDRADQRRTASLSCWSWDSSRGARRRPGHRSRSRSSWRTSSRCRCAEWCSPVASRAGRCSRGRTPSCTSPGTSAPCG